VIDVLIIGITFGLIYGLVAISYSLIWQSMNLIHFAQGDLLMIGGFIAITLCNSGITHMFPVLIITFVALALIGAIMQNGIYRFIPQKNVVTRIISTLGMGIIFKNIAVLVWGSNSHALPENFFPGNAINILGISIRPVYYWTLLISAILVVLLMLFLYKTKFGLAVRLTAYNTELAKLMGVNPSIYQTVAFSLAIGITGVAGILCSPISYVSYKMGLAFGVKGFAAAIIGGLDSFPGAIVGGIIIGLIEVAFGQYLSGYIDAVVFGIMILVLVVRPHGIFGKAKAVKI
jgi:branched-chain amino acid transport system permease protein